MSQSVEAYERKLEETEAELLICQRQLEKMVEMASDLEDIKQRAVEWRTKCEEKDKEITRLSYHLEEMSETMEHVANEHQEVELRKQSLEAASAHLDPDGLGKEVVALKEKLTETKKERDNLLLKCEEFDSWRQTSTAELGKIKAENEQLVKTEIANYNSKIQELKTEIANYNAQLESTQAELSAVKTQLNDNVKKVAELEVVKVSCTEQKEQLEAQNATIKKLEADASNNEELALAAEQSNQADQETIAQLQSSLREKEVQLKAEQKGFQEMQSNCNRLSKQLNEVSTLKSQITQRELELKTVTGERDKLANELTTVTNEKNNKIKRVGELELALKAKIDERRYLTNENKELKFKVTKLTRKVSEAESRTVTVSSKEVEEKIDVALRKLSKRQKEEIAKMKKSHLARVRQVKGKMIVNTVGYTKQEFYLALWVPPCVVLLLWFLVSQF